MLGLTREDLAKLAEVAIATLTDFEGGKRTPYNRTLTAIRTALEAAGVIFIDQNGEGPGVRLRRGVEATTEPQGEKGVKP